VPARVYAVSLLLEGRRALVVGGGALARARAAGLLAAGARVTVVAPSLEAGFEDLAIEHWARPYRRGDAASFRIVLAASGDHALDEAVYEDGERLGVLVNAADRPESSAFFLPALLRRGALQIAFSTGGRSPAIASWARDRVGALFGDEVAELVELVGGAREALHGAGRTSAARPWRALIDALCGALGEGDEDGARRQVAAWLADELGRQGSEASAE